MAHWGMIIDMGRCSGCRTCVVACQLEHSLHPGIAWNRVDTLEWGRWPHADRAFLPHACLHCDKPLCVEVCPTGASAKRPDNIVTIDEDLCIGCGVCMTACRYGARTINTSSGWHYGASTPAPYERAGADRRGVAEKCTLCANRIDAGGVPACVEGCPTAARLFGDWDDPTSSVSVFADHEKTHTVEGSAVHYAMGGHDFDIENTLRAPYASAKSSRNESTPPEANPAVIAAAAVATVGVGAGLYAAARHGKAQRAAQGPASFLQKNVRHTTTVSNPDPGEE